MRPNEGPVSPIAPGGWVAVLMLALVWTLGCGERASRRHDETVVGSAEFQVASGPVAPGTQSMAERLRLLRDNGSLDGNAFRNPERLARWRQQALPEEPRARWMAQRRLAEEALRAGESKQAAETFATLLVDLENLGPEAERLRRPLQEALAVAYLRQGEQENCLHHPGGDNRTDAGSAFCLFPIEDDGRHVRTQGAASARAVLAQLLEDDPDHLLHRWLDTVAAMTLGEYPGGVPETWRIPPHHFRSDASMAPFVDVAPQVGLAVSGLAGGSVVEDFNGDGLLDVMVSSWGIDHPLTVLEARHDGSHLRFEDVTASSGLATLPGGLNLVPADFDNDGDVDVLVLRGAWLSRHGRWPNSLLRNNGNGVFEDVTEEVGLLSFHPTQTAAWGDVDNDGWLDLFIGNESVPAEPHASELFRNLGADGDGARFVDVAKTAGVEVRGFVKGVTWGDVDNDGWIDLYVSRLRGANQLFRNLGGVGGDDDDGDGGLRFEEVGERAGVQEPMDSFPTWFFDYDQDGWLDLFVGDYATDFVGAWVTPTVADYLGQPVEGGTSRLYRNRGDGTFADVSAEVGLERPLLAMGANFGDVDNDGWPDLYIGTGAPDFSALVPNRLFRNDGGERFLDVTSAARVGHLQKGHGVSFADLDHDGDQDILAVLGGAFSGDIYQNALFANPGYGNAWVTLVLEGVTSNRPAIGARLHLRLETPGGERSVFSTVTTGGSFGASTLRQELGLGDATAITSLDVTWPGGESEEFRDVPMERCVRIRQGDGVVEPMDCPTLMLVGRIEASSE